MLTGITRPTGDAYLPWAIAMLDPLDADATLAKLSDMNTSADVREMVSSLNRILPTREHLTALSGYAAWAAMRDVGLFLGSLKRLGIEPVDAVPDLEPVLLELGTRTRMIPRDTVYHYTDLNPRGFRQRTYTADPQEAFLIDAVRTALQPMDDVMTLCHTLTEIDPGTEEAPVLLSELSTSMASFEEAIDSVMDRVRPRFFAEQLRPFFEEVKVGHETYLGPAAAHVPLFLVDLTLWASDNATADYAEFCREAARYLPPRWRAILSRCEQPPSLLTKVAAVATRPSSTPIPAPIRESAEELCEVLRTVMKFRGKHVTVARKAYRIESCKYELGSGGGSISLLQNIANDTRRHLNLLRQACRSRDPACLRTHASHP